MTDTILLIADSTDLVPFADALSVRGFIARGLSLSTLPPGLDFADVRAIVLCDSTEPHPRAVSRLLQAVGENPLPIVVALPEQHRTQRDSCLIAGAGDVAIGAHPEDVASRVDAAVNGWSRASPRRKLRASLKAQRGRQMIDLQIVDIDPSGFGIVPVESVPAGSLLRTNLLLPDGEMLTWGRLASGDDGSPGVRFVALMPEERQRIVTAIRTKPGAAGTSPGLVPAPATGGPAPAPERTVTGPYAGVTITASSAPPPVVPATPGPAASPAASGTNAIADAIGELLGGAEQAPSGDAPLVTPAPDLAASPAGTEPAPAVSAETRRWPTVTYQPEAAESVLAHACSLGLAGDEDGAPSGERVLAFVRTLTTIERRAFDADPPPELPEPALARKCLAMRLRLFALTQEASEIPMDAGTRASIDDELLSQLYQEAKSVNGELQKVLDGFVATAQTQRIKEVNGFRNALTKGVSELRGAITRLRGETADGRSNAALLDVEQKNEAGPATVVRREAPKEPEKKEQDVYAPQSPASKEARRKRRIAVWTVLFVLSLVAIIFLRPRKARLLTAAEYADVGEVTEVIFEPRRNHATIRVTSKWRPDPVHTQQVKQFVSREGFDSFVVLNDKQQAMVLGRKGKPMTVLRTDVVKK